MRFSSVLFPEVEDVLDAHSASLDAHGGLAGVRDGGLLESAVMAPRSGYYDSLASLAAAFCFGIARNHAFLDGNKRTAVVTAFAFLRVNGVVVTAPQHETHAIVDGLAAGRVSRDALVEHFTTLMGGDPRPLEDLPPPEPSQVRSLLERRPDRRG